MRLDSKSPNTQEASPSKPHLSIPDGPDRLPALKEPAANDSKPKGTELSSQPVRPEAVDTPEETHADPSPKGLAALAELETRSEWWPDGLPTSAGWFHRVRIVQADFKPHLIRLVENVRVTVTGATVAVVENRVLDAAAAAHVLIDSADLDEVPKPLEATISPRNPHIARVGIPDPGNPRSLPNTLENLTIALGQRVESDRLIELCALPADPLVGNGTAWHLENLGLLGGQNAGSDINAAEGWDHRTDASNQMIALIDSGTNHAHPDLAANIHIFQGETFGDGIDNDGNGYADDVFGYDFIDDDGDPRQDEGHANYCALLMGGRGDNGYGSSGVAWRARILDCRVFNNISLGLLSDAIDSIDYARASGARILNLSWAYQGDAPLLEDALRRCNDEGIIMVCASGNYGSQLPVPAPAKLDLPLIVAVAASKADSRLAAFSSVDPAIVDLAAPGANLAVPYGSFVKYVSGTSFSASLVSGALALALEHFPDDTPSRIIQRLHATSVPISGGNSALLSGGGLDLGKFLGTAEPVLSHDHFVDRRIFLDAEGYWTGGTEGAGIGSVDASISPLPTRSIWFEWTARNDGLLAINIEHPENSPAEVRVFKDISGLPGKELQSLIETDEQTDGNLYFEVKEGDRLFWLLNSSSPIESGIILRWLLPPSNDNWADAIELTGLPLRFSGNTIGATAEDRETDSEALENLILRSVWWRWTAPSSAPLGFFSDRTHLAIVLPLTPGGKPDFQGYRTTLIEAGKEYAIMVVPTSESVKGPFEFVATTPDQLEILEQPKSLAAVPGESAELSITVASSSYLTYRWFKDGEEIPLMTLATLPLRPVSERTFGTYHVVVSNGVIERQSEPAIVSVREAPPRLITRTPRYSLIVGQSVNLSTTFRSGSPITYEWFKGGELIPGESNPVLTIQDAEISDASTYRVTATNAAGSVSTEIIVDVIETPWDGWVERTPGRQGRGAILATDQQDGVLVAMTETEWLTSTDGGSSWETESMPDHFTATFGAMLPNGTALVYGKAFSGSLPKCWRKLPGGNWQPSPIIIEGTDGSSEEITIYQLESFGSKFYAEANGRLLKSSDGLSWETVTHQSYPQDRVRSRKILATPEFLCVTTYEEPCFLIDRDDVMTPIHLSRGLPDFFRNSEGLYLFGYGDGPLFVPHDGVSEASITESLPWISGGFVVGTDQDGFFSGLSADEQVIISTHGEPLRGRSAGISSWSFDGTNWLAGFFDGTIWTGTDPREIQASQTVASGNPKLVGLNGEYFFNSYPDVQHQSSDGTHWHKHGPVSPAIYGKFGGFLIQENPDPVPNARRLGSASYSIPISGPHDRFVLDSFKTPYGILTGTSGPNYWPLTHHHVEGSEVLSEVLPLESPGIDARIFNSVFSDNQWFLYGRSRFEKFVARSSDGVNWSYPNGIQNCLIGYRPGQFIALENTTRGFISPDGITWAPTLLSGLEELPQAIHHLEGFFLAQVGKRLFTSEDGIAWSEASAPEPAAKIATNGLGLVLETTGGSLYQPGGQTSSGPWIELPEALRITTVPLRQRLYYEVEAGDEDGDLISVECRVNDVLLATLTSPPYRFSISPDESGDHAIEFSARDSHGRIARTTATLRAQAIGVASGGFFALPADIHISQFHDRYYAVYASVLWSSTDGDRWTQTGLTGIVVNNLLTDDRALLATTTTGLMVSIDGVSWVELSGLTGTNIVSRPEGFYFGSNSANWFSPDGLHWSPTERPFPGSQGSLAHWVDDDFGFVDGLFTLDGGLNWFPVQDPPSYYGSEVVAMDGYFLITGRSTDLGPDGGHGLYRLDRGSPRFVQIFPNERWDTKVMLTKGTSRAFYGVAGVFLKSSEDGVTWADHTPMPNTYRPRLVRVGSQWMAISADKICSSEDLTNWEVLFDFNDSPGGGPWGVSDYIFHLQPRPDGGLMMTASSWPFLNRSLLIHPDKTIRWAEDEVDQTGSDDDVVGLNYGPLGTGIRFKDKTLVYGPWIHVSEDHGRSWTRAYLRPDENFDTSPYILQNWPMRGDDSWFGAIRHAAAGTELFLAFTSSRIWESHDGINFTVREWDAPIPASEIISLTAGSDGFLALATEGRVMFSEDGNDWTLTTLDPDLELKKAIRHNGTWQAYGATPYKSSYPTVDYGVAQRWSSPDGIVWTKAWDKVRTNYYRSDWKAPFSAFGKAWIWVHDGGWFMSENGTDWLPDPMIESITSEWTIRGEHPDGFLASSYPRNTAILDRQSGEVLREITLASSFDDVVWIDGWPFLKTAGRMLEWIEEDPRLISVHSESGEYGVGETLTVDVGATELPANTVLRFLLNPGNLILDGDEIAIGSSPWISGNPVDDQTRRFSLPLPPTLQAGTFQVIVQLQLDPKARDGGHQNNSLGSIQHGIEVPGFEMRVTKSGEGHVESSDSRQLYPKGASVDLSAVPAQGYVFESWQGDMASTQSNIDLVMDGDKELSLSFRSAWSIRIKSIGGGEVEGAPASLMLENGRSLTLSANPLEGWEFDCWQVDGARIESNPLSFKATRDQLISACFKPDLNQRRATAFDSTPPTISRDWSSDPDHDGMTTWLELLLGQSPTTPSPPPLKAIGTAPRLRYLFKRPQSTDPSIWPEFMTPSSPWSREAPTGISIRTLLVTAGIETIEVTIDTTATSSTFLRLRYLERTDP